LSWLAIQVCYLHVLRIGGRGTESATDWLLPFFIIMTYGCYNIAQLMFALKFWGLSIKLMQVATH
jgi:hypothetical protein